MSTKQHEPRDEQPKAGKPHAESPATEPATSAAAASAVSAADPSGAASAPGAPAATAAPAAECPSEEEVFSAEGRALTAEARLDLALTELATAREEVSVLNDKYLRKLADEANFRKRVAREKEDGVRFATAALLGDLVPILDDFDRAVSSAETARDYGVLHDGIVLIRRQLGQLLENKYGLKRFESLGKPFDPHHHEAVAMELASEGEISEPTVAEEFLPGYGLHERVVRTAKVKVRMPHRPASGIEAEPEASRDVGPSAVADPASGGIPG